MAKITRNKLSFNYAIIPNTNDQNESRVHGPGNIALPISIVPRNLQSNESNAGLFKETFISGEKLAKAGIDFSTKKVEESFTKSESVILKEVNGGLEDIAKINKPLSTLIEDGQLKKKISDALSFYRNGLNKGKNQTKLVDELQGNLPVEFYQILARFPLDPTGQKYPEIEALEEIEELTTDVFNEKWLALGSIYDKRMNSIKEEIEKNLPQNPKSEVSFVSTTTSEKDDHYKAFLQNPMAYVKNNPSGISKFFKNSTS